MNNDKHLMTGFEGNSEAGNSLNLSVTVVVGQHSKNFQLYNNPSSYGDLPQQKIVLHTLNK